jgi:hypothetical protein
MLKIVKFCTYKVNGDNEVVLLVFVLLVLFVGLVGTGRRLWGRLHLSLLRRRLRRGFVAGGRALGPCSRRALLPNGVAIGGFVARLSNDPKEPSVMSEFA